MELRDRHDVVPQLKASFEGSSWRSLSKNDQRAAPKKSKRRGLSQLDDSSPSGPAGPEYPGQANPRYMKRKPSSNRTEDVSRDNGKDGEEVGRAISADALSWIAQFNAHRPESRRPATCFHLNCSDKDRSSGDMLKDNLQPHLWSEFSHLPYEEEQVPAVKTRSQSRMLKLMDSSERRNVRGPISRQSACYPHPEHGPVDAGLREMNGSPTWAPAMMRVQEIAV